MALLSIYGERFYQFIREATERPFQAPDGRNPSHWVLVSRNILPGSVSGSDTCPWRMTYGETVDGEPVPHGHVEARDYRMACVEARAFGGDLLRARFA